MDSILGRAPLEKIEILNPFKLWCISNDYSKLQDFSKWIVNDLWQSWKNLSPPDQLLLFSLFSLSNLLDAPHSTHIADILLAGV